MILPMDGIHRLSRDERKQETRRQLVEAAARVFAAEGFEAASLDKVAEAAGFTKGAVYSNFRDKTDLFMAIIERRVEDQVRGSVEAFRNVTLQQALEALDAASEGEGFDPGWLMLVGEFWLHAMRHPEARAALAAEYARARALSTEMIAAKYAEAGDTPPMPPRDIAIVLEALGIGLGFQVAIDPGAVSMSLQGTVVARLLRGTSDDPDERGERTTTREPGNLDEEPPTEQEGPDGFAAGAGASAER